MDWKIGNARITQVRDVVSKVPVEMIYRGSDPAVAVKNASWLQPHFVDADGLLDISVHALIVESESMRVLIDPCWGDRSLRGMPHVSNLGSGFLDRMSDAGFSVMDIDMVVCTHLHDDHVGWNTRLVDGEWVPTFANARYLFGRLEYEFWIGGGWGRDESAMIDAIRPVVDAGLVDFVETDHRINSELSLFASPGHTPGHMSLRISFGGEKAVVTGDLMHSPIQIAAQNWTMFLDDDPAQAVRSRIEFIERHNDSDVRVFGTHFPGPASGFIETFGDGHRFRV